jgi:hypothetical protein
VRENRIALHSADRTQRLLGTKDEGSAAAACRPACCTSSSRVTGKEVKVKSEEVQVKDEHEWLGMLEAAMTMERSLVLVLVLVLVLCDPWLLEQGRCAT